MKFHEIDALVSKHLGHYRLFDWRQVEGMRDALARYGAALSLERSRVCRA